jgi:hypothetical protein
MSYTFSEIVKNKKVVFGLLLILVLIPTYFIHTRSYPDWGDDFAQYVYQAQQINTPSKVYKEVLNIEEYSSGKKRSVFFSLTMSAITPTLVIEKYVNFIAVTYILAAVSFFLFLSCYYLPSISFLTTLCVFYNFLFLRLKSEVVPEFLFIALCFFIFFVFEKCKKSKSVIIPFLIALLFSVRFLGLTMFLAYLLHVLFNTEKSGKEKLKELIKALAVFAIVVLIINTVFLQQVYNQEIKLYGSYLFENFEFNLFFKNAYVYITYIALFFEQEIPFWLNTIIISLVTIFFAIGFSISLKSKRGFIEYFYVIYFLFLFSYPVNNDTIRYLIPIIPLFFYYTLSGFISALSYFKIKWGSNAIVLGCLSAVLLSNSKTIWLAIKNENKSVGPYNEVVLSDFKKIQKIVKENESIAFAKPFIISLLADRHSYFLSPSNYKDIFDKTDFVLLSKPSIAEIYPKTIGINISKGDTTELNCFYLIKL